MGGVDGVWGVCFKWSFKFKRAQIIAKYRWSAISLAISLPIIIILIYCTPLLGDLELC